MTLLSITQSLAKDVGLAVPDQVFGSSNRSMVEIIPMANAVGEELARRVDWGQLTSTATLTGDGTNLTHTLPSGFGRIVGGIGVKTATGTYARPLTRAEWGSLTPIEGVPRYYLLQDTSITLWPYLADTIEATVYYQTDFWCSNGTAAWSADDETSLIDEDLFLKGLIVRWRRQKGMPYEDQEAEYEAALQDLARFNDRSRL